MLEKNIKYEKKRSEYEKYMKEVTDKFMSMCSNKEYYLDLCNDTLEGRLDDRISFWPCRPDVLFKCVLDGDFNKEGVKKRIQKRQEDALDWLKKNTISFYEFKAKKTRP